MFCRRSGRNFCGRAFLLLCGVLFISSSPPFSIYNDLSSLLLKTAETNNVASRIDGSRCNLGAESPCRFSRCSNLSRKVDMLIESHDGRYLNGRRIIDFVFILNSKNVPERKKHMVGLMDSWNMKSFVIVDENDTEILHERIDQLFSSDLGRYQRTSNATLRSSSLTDSVQEVTPLSVGEKSLALAHFVVWETIFCTPSIQKALILEDDVIPILHGNILVALNSFIQGIESLLSVRDPWILYPGYGQGETESIKNFVRYKNNLLIHPDHISKYSDTYLINSETADCFVRRVIPFSLAVDWQMTWASKVCNATTFHTAQHLTRQGSGKEFKSSLRP